MGVGSNIRFLINRRGRSATFSVASGSSYDPSTGEASSATTDYQIKAYFAESILGEGVSDEVSVGMRQVAFGPYDINGDVLPIPNTEDTIVDNTDTLVVGNVQKIYNGEALILYICTVKE